MDNNLLFQDLLGIKKPNKSQKKAVENEVKNTQNFDFMTAIKSVLNDESHNISYTENGAKGYKTTGKPLLDLNFAVSSLRQQDEFTIAKKFRHAFADAPMESMLWLFYLRDVRGGMGERRTFRIILKDLTKSNLSEVAALLPYIAEYGRFDDLWELLNTKMEKPILELIKAQLISDINNMNEKKSISLLGKWLPSNNTSSRKTRRYASRIYQGLGLEPATYQKICAALRKYLKVVERDMSAQRWTVINYNTVPARANLIYNNAFLRNDEERRRAYLGSLKKHDGSAKINAGTLFPYEIVTKYNSVRGIDDTLEELWKALPDVVNGAGNVMVVADGSGSMNCRIGKNGEAKAIDVANALAIYFAERSSGPYMDKYITFSEHPKYVDLSNCRNLRDKIRCARSHNEVANTNIQAVFELILETAKQNKLKQADLPGTILVLSDMEFDSCVVTSKKTTGRYGGTTYSRPDVNLFGYIKKQYSDTGYKMPKVVFWNLNSRTGTIPVKENALGVGLVSGFSTSIFKMVLSNKLDPYDALKEQLFTERYKPIYDVLVPFHGKIAEMEELEE